jgi:hypothetical protein
MTYHILNGDALDHQLPSQIVGERIIMRECLMEGPVQASSFDSFVSQRSDYVSKAFEDSRYYEWVVPELRKIHNIKDGSEVFLWFEDDVYCQVNLWYVLHQLADYSNLSLYLVRPTSKCPYSFGCYHSDGLIQLFEQAVPVSHISELANLWNCYQHEDWTQLKSSAATLADTYPFITPAVTAQIERIPNQHSEGRPIETLKKIVAEIGSDSFKDIFIAFSEKEAIYGMGDLQVRNMLHELTKT